MKLKLICTVMGFITSCAAFAGDCLISGTWKSDETKTIANMNTEGNVTDKQRKFFENNFFGKLTIKTTCNEFTTYYEEHVETAKYKSVEVNGNEITTTYFDKLDGEEVTRTVTLEDNGKCYSIPIEHLGFKEYFCKVQ